MAETTTFRYRAFLSYSHRDKSWGKWLHSALEGYRIDKDLVGRETPAGPVPTTLRPVFRDREDFSAGHSLTEQTIAALEASKFLIVICSPNAAKSKYVNEEVRYFKAMGRATRVIPVIIDGDPGDLTRECFPPAVRFWVGPDGEVTDEPEEPIAADARPQGDGKEIAKQKVVAGLLGLGLDEIVRRAVRVRRARNRFWTTLSGVFLFLAIAAAMTAIHDYQKTIESEDRLDQTIESASGYVTEAASLFDRFGIPTDITLRLLKHAEASLDGLISKGADTPKLQYRKVLMLMAFARDYAVLGQTDKQHDRLMEAHQLMQRLSDEDPSNLAWQNDLSVSYERVGDVLVVERKLDEALASYRTGLAIREHLVAIDPGDTFRQRNLSVLQARIGDVLLRQGNSVEALTSYLAALSIVSHISKGDPTNTVWLRDKVVLVERLGDMLKTRGNFNEALAAYSAAVAMFEALADSDPENTIWPHDLSQAHVGVRDVLLAQGKFDDALERYRTGLRLSQRLANADLTNALWQRDLMVLQSRIGDVLRMQGKLDEALATYRAARNGQDRLAIADPTNTNLRRDLSTSYEKIGDLLLAQGKLDGALASYRNGVAICETLVATDPTNAAWLGDLSASHNRIGLVLEKQGNAADALQSFRTSHAIVERLAAADPENVELQLDRLSANFNLARYGDDPARRIAFIVTTLRKLKGQNKLPAEKAGWLPLAEELLAKLQQP